MSSHFFEVRVIGIILHHFPCNHASDDTTAEVPCEMTVRLWRPPLSPGETNTRERDPTNVSSWCTSWRSLVSFRPVTFYCRLRPSEEFDMWLFEPYGLLICWTLLARLRPAKKKKKRRAISVGFPLQILHSHSHLFLSESLLFFSDCMRSFQSKACYIHSHPDGAPLVVVHLLFN